MAGMGSQSPEDVPMSIRRRKVESVADMLREHWEVISVCRKCALTMAVDLRVIARLKGPATSLWNRHGRCRRIGCVGVVDFQAKVPGVPFHRELSAPWPEGKPPAEGR